MPIGRQAFTLVELLVVISIIGLLSSIAVVSLGSARVKARNAKRIADVERLAQAFYLANNASGSGTYPGTAAPVCLSTVCTGAWSGFPVDSNVDSFISPYIASKLTDPPDSNRTYGGYGYNGNWAGGVGFDGTFPPDAHIAYNLEGAVSCGPGRIWLQSAARTECILPLNQL